MGTHLLLISLPHKNIALLCRSRCIASRFSADMVQLAGRQHVRTAWAFDHTWVDLVHVHQYILSLEHTIIAGGDGWRKTKNGKSHSHASESRQALTTLARTIKSCRSHQTQSYKHTPSPTHLFTQSRIPIHLPQSPSYHLAAAPAQHCRGPGDTCTHANIKTQLSSPAKSPDVIGSAKKMRQ